MNTRKRFHAVMNFQPFDRLPLLEWAGWWDKTIDRWHGEGLPVDLTDRYAICKHFGLDIYKQDWFPVRGPECPQPAAHGSGIIESVADYERIRPYLYPSEPVDAARWRARAAEQEQGDVVLWFTVDGFFWFARRLLGIERHLYAFYDQPELMHRINSDLSDWILLVIEQVCSICTPDFMTFGEDMSYNNGPMLSKDCFDEFMRPYYDRIIPALRDKGVIPIIDSDGDIAIPAHWFAEAGLEGILPLERQARWPGLVDRLPKRRFNRNCTFSRNPKPVSGLMSSIRNRHEPRPASLSRLARVRPGRWGRRVGPGWRPRLFLDPVRFSRAIL